MSEMPYVLACDVGNTRIHFATVYGESVEDVQAFRIGDLAHLGPALAKAWGAMPAPKKIVASSVNVNGLNALEAALAESVGEHLLLVGRDLPLPIATSLAEPRSIGTDRLCAAIAAFDRLGVACVVGSFGTAATVDAVNDEGVFLGGAILPGLSMGAAALHRGTSKLPPVELSAPDWVFGSNTRQAMVGGLIFGARGALRELVENYATQLGRWPVVILTGGDAHLICPDPNESELVQAIVSDLVLRGVAIAYYKTLVGG